MSWLDDVVDFGSSIVSGVGNFFSNNNIGSTLLKTALTGGALWAVNSTKKSNDAAPSSGSAGSPSAPAASAGAKTSISKPIADRGTRQQLGASTDTNIPVLYGNSICPGYMIDARMSTDRRKMWYVMVMCERTGIRMSDGIQSEVSFDAVYWNDMKIVFQADNITAAALEDRTGNQETNVNGLVKVYCYNNGSNNGTLPGGASGLVPAAYTIVPGWSSDWTLDQLVFAVIEVTYSADNAITGIGKMTFDLTNSMDQPGDCLYDMMTNTRYGAAIATSDIKAT